MNSKEIREAFLTFFKNKEHHIVNSAPMVLKDDPTLMFTNAGMNQFKDIFLGNSPIKYKRIADTQKCLRVSGKHNDLEEVGHDTYHHTMFEMLGNWSFGDYFKKEAIDWGWEFLTKELDVPKDRLYVTVFEGCKEDGLEADSEALETWAQIVDKDRILYGSKKDNFWEMGDTGPCGPCSEIHIDLRDDAERKKIPGKNLVNQDHPEVIEIWNLVFIQYNRKSNGELELLPHKHVDTGMGFERLCMVLQKKRSNYDTDVFQPIIREIENISGIKYGVNPKTDIAMRVISDHLRAVAFSIADGQLPSNIKAGYVIRRILRRAVRYAYSFLNLNEPVIYKLLPAIISVMGDEFIELKAQQQLIEKVIEEEELSFLRTLDMGIKRLNDIMGKTKSEKKNTISGKAAFELYDTFGFPLDLTQLILRENNLSVEMEEFNKQLEEQKDRSRQATKTETEDWTVLAKDDVEEFIGYDYLESDVIITRYRKVKAKGKEFYHLIFNITPFYAESGGQVGDTGYIENLEEKIEITNTIKENNVIVHIADKLPANPNTRFKAIVDERKRISTANNHSATHLMHHALRQVLGNHVEQKGSLVHPDYLRFDFAHFQKVSPEELKEIERLVNEEIRKNVPIDEKRAIPMSAAKDIGAMALFGEKYGDLVRVIQFGESIELCGGTHVHSTGQIGLFKIISESSIAAGIRRIEAISGEKAQEYINNELETLENIRKLLDHPQQLITKIELLLQENNSLKKELEAVNKDSLKNLKSELANKVNRTGDINIIAEKVDLDDTGAIKDLSFQLKDQIDNLFLVLGAEIDGKANLAIMISDSLVKDKGLHAGNIIREAAKEIQGGGGGQPFFATAGGKNPAGIENALKKAISLVSA
ncbi:MAG: alanine--tRNA ligase [Bacteroidales bacterium]|nr:alanine--tRNA ligase [Bacteroidales bacterium]